MSLFALASVHAHFERKRVMNTHWNDQKQEPRLLSAFVADFSQYLMSFPKVFICPMEEGQAQDLRWTGAGGWMGVLQRWECSGEQEVQGCDSWQPWAVFHTFISASRIRGKAILYEHLISIILSIQLRPRMYDEKKKKNCSSSLVSYFSAMPPSSHWRHTKTPHLQPVPGMFLLFLGQGFLCPGQTSDLTM